MHDNVQAHVVRLSRQFLEDEEFDITDWPPNSSEHVSGHPMLPQTAQELSDALIQIWEEIPQGTISCLIGNMLQCCQAHYFEYHFEWLYEILAKWTSMQIVFTFIFWMSLNFALCKLMILISIKNKCGTVSFLTVIITKDIQHDWVWMCLHFFEQFINYLFNTVH